MCKYCEIGKPIRYCSNYYEYEYTKYNYSYTITEIKECLKNGLFKIIQILTHEQFEANCYKVGGENNGR